MRLKRSSGYTGKFNVIFLCLSQTDLFIFITKRIPKFKFKPDLTDLPLILGVREEEKGKDRDDNLDNYLFLTQSHTILISKHHIVPKSQIKKRRSHIRAWWWYCSGCYGMKRSLFTYSFCGTLMFKSTITPQKPSRASLSLYHIYWLSAFYFCST
jgi:hypothetical protein